jgi:hypothetical protein
MQTIEKGASEEVNVVEYKSAIWKSHQASLPVPLAVAFQVCFFLFTSRMVNSHASTHTYTHVYMYTYKTICMGAVEP